MHILKQTTLAIALMSVFCAMASAKTYTQTYSYLETDCLHQAYVSDELKNAVGSISGNDLQANKRQNVFAKVEKYCKKKASPINGETILASSGRAKCQLATGTKKDSRQSMECLAYYECLKIGGYDFSKVNTEVRQYVTATISWTDTGTAANATCKFTGPAKQNEQPSGGSLD